MKATEEQINAINEVMRNHRERLFREELERTRSTYTINPHRIIKTWDEYYNKYKTEIESSIWSRIK